MVRHFLCTLLMAAMMLLSACGSVQVSSGGISAAQPAVQYAVMKLIEESDSVDGQDVINFVNKARNVADTLGTEVDVINITEEIVGLLDVDSMAASDKFLVLTILNQVQVSVNDVSIPNSDRVVKLYLFLDWVEQAAKF